MTNWINGDFGGNPSSLHNSGGLSKIMVEIVRGEVADLIRAKNSKEIFFTSGGTESDNMAIMGMLPYLKRQGKDTVVLSAVEHHAILHQKTRIEEAGFNCVILPVDNQCIVDLSKLRYYLDNYHVGLVSVMLANNETGVIQPIKEVSEMCHEYDTVVHTDAVQAVGHMNVDVQCLGVDFLSMSGHKLGAPTGIGALYIREKYINVFTPMILGGGQEGHIRAGTENMLAIVGLGVVVKEIRENLSREIQHYKTLHESFQKRLCSLSGDGVVFNFCNRNKLNNIASITAVGVEAEGLLRTLDYKYRICVSAASACSAGSVESSHVLRACWPESEEKASMTFRVSFGLQNTVDEVESAAEMIADGIKWWKSMYEVRK